MIAKTFAIQKMVLQSNSYNRIMVQRTLRQHDSIPEHQERPWHVLRSHNKLADHL
jgi:hypothetical protein